MECIIRDSSRIYTSNEEIKRIYEIRFFFHNNQKKIH